MLIRFFTAALGAALLLAAARPASAQEGSILLGFTKTNIDLTGPGVLPTGSESGYVVGGAISTSTDRPISLEVEGLFTTKGTTLASGLTIQLYYLDAPLLARTDAKVGKTVRIHGYAGPQVGYLVRTGGAAVNFSVDEITRADISAVVGGGIDWRGTMVDLRYTRGLNDLTSPNFFGAGRTARSQTLGVVFSFRVK